MPKVGETLTCHETGKQFVVSTDGFSFNYATDSKGNYYSDEGVDIRERHDLQDRSKPFCAYLNSDCTKLTGWKGNILGAVTWKSPTNMRSNWGKVYSVNVVDVHGGRWYGRAVPGCCITLRPMK